MTTSVQHYTTMKDLINAVKSDEIIGFVKLSLCVPEGMIERFSEFPPVFKKTVIGLEDIGETMQKFVKTQIESLTRTKFLFRVCLERTLLFQRL